jgi:cephalosporin-C deacetylase-like acetyl esterase
MNTLDFILRSGRAILYPIYKGQYERRIEPPFGEAPGPQRDRSIHQFKDFGRAIDYLETRPEIDRDRLAYYGYSAGGHIGPLLLALERRPKVAVFLDGGFTSHARLPDGDVLNFAPRMKIPVLMLNSRYDFVFPVESSQLPMFRMLGTAEKDKRHVIYNSAHNAILMRNEVVREVLDWLDRYLGSVRR